MLKALNRKKTSAAAEICLIAFTILLHSCKSIISRPELVDFANPPDYKRILLEYRKKYPQKLSINQSAVIEMGFKKIAALGLCSFNTENGDISLVLMTTTGIKLIELKKKSGKTETRFTIPEFSENKNVGKQLLEDVETIYGLPARKHDYCEIRRNSLTYGWTDSKKRTELIFGKTEKAGNIELLTKKVYFDNTPVSIVYYSDYELRNGRNIPMRISYKNKKFKYSLVLKTREVFCGVKDDRS